MSFVIHLEKLFTTVALISATFTIAFCQETRLNEDLCLKYLVKLPDIKSEHAPVIILLHGRGGSERNLFALRTSVPKNYLVVAAEAPFTANGGGYEWFGGTIVDGELMGNEDQIESSRAVIGKFIDQIVNKYKADPRQVYLIGFSQGARMCYEVGLTAPDKLKGIGVLSGMMFEALKPFIKNIEALKQLKIFIGHGTADERIKFTHAVDADNYLKNLGLNTEFHSYPRMHHQISDDELVDLLKWLKE